MRQRILFLSLSCMVVCSIGFGEPAKLPQVGVGLTIYSDNFAVVKDTRRMEFKEGLNTVEFPDVAAAIDPTTVSFRCPDSPKMVSIVEQSYRYDFVSSEVLLGHYIDKEVTITVKGSGSATPKRLTGRLLAISGNDLILKSEINNIEIISRNILEEITLQPLPEKLITKPTLIWLANSQEQGTCLCTTTYTTEQIKWQADYLAILNADETRLDFTGWVTIDNKSGADFKDATIKLVAGDVRKVTAPVRSRRRMVLAEAAAPAGFEEKSFAEYHLYTLGRTATIEDRQSKQIEFITPATGIQAKKIYLYQRKPKWFYERAETKDKVNVKVEFENTRENSLGIALAKGKIRVFKRDPADDSIEFVGEDKIDHTPRKEKLSLYIGDAFDIVPQYTLVDGKYYKRHKREKHKIELRNRKNRAVTVFVDEKFPARHNWTIEEFSQKYEKIDARTARFRVRISANSTATIEYATTESW